MERLSYDLHIHSCLSPCGDNDMTPANIIGMAMLKQLDLIALTDHNSAKNTIAMMELSKETDLIVIPGMELTTAEEVHVLCLFKNLSDALAMDAYAYEALLKIPNEEKIFGEQLVVDSRENIIQREANLLINATAISFAEVYDVVKSFHGNIIPAHIDKNANSLLSQLGFIPEDSRFTCAELKDLRYLNDLKTMHPYLNSCSIVTDSDAHYLGDINEAVNRIDTEERSIDAVFDALFGTGK